MNSKQMGKPKHLFVVKEQKLQGGSSSASRVVSAENLNAEQRARIQELIAKSRSPGVLVGALVGAEGWDLRPLLLHEGLVGVLRFSDPRLSLDRERYAAFKLLNRELSEQSLGNCLLGSGEAEGQIWIRRRFFQHTLADGGLDWLPYHPVQFVQRLLRALSMLHRANIIHGHICLSNVAYDERGPLFLDHGFSVARGTAVGESADMAPELSLGRADVATDVYGIGLVLKVLLAEEAGTSKFALIEKMTHQDALQRPRLQQVLETFSPQEARVPEATGANPVTRVGVATGKLLNSSPANPSTAVSRAGSAPGPHSESLPRMEPVETAVVKVPKIISAPRSAKSSPATPPKESERPPRSLPVEGSERRDNIQTGSVIPRPLYERLPDTSTSMDRTQELQAQIRSEHKSSTASPVKLEKSQERRGFLALPAVFLASLGAAIVLFKFGAFDRLLGTEADVHIPYANYWASNQPSLMQQVAQAAVEQDQEAQLVVVGDALKGTSRPMVRSNLIRSAFNPLWERELLASDRAIILGLALSRLLGGSKLNLPPISEAHAAVVLAVAGDLQDLSNPEGPKEFVEVPLDRMTSLPMPYGLMFDQLRRLGVSNLADPQARALAHILSGDLSEASLGAFFQQGDKRLVALAKIAMLLPIMEKAPKVADVLYAVLSSQMTPLLDRVQWFGLEEIAEWGKVPKALWFALMAGADVKATLTLQQWADLLLFPDIRVRERAKQRLAKDFFTAQYLPTLAFLSSEENSLSRLQTVSLASVFKAEGEVGYSMLANVLSSKPNPQAILGLLMARANFAKADAVSLDLARYLGKSQWHATLEQLKELAGHPERYARVLAYTRLNPEVPEEREILESAEKVEPHEATRRLIADKLSTPL